ncbi:uncharacterized protein LOC111788778 isoform X3 [Cucurbita pepo subsp. pepo]|uniref:uncharacterized protein LOC111788778 isoform X3 n=1 Tax=Cucurbita pepo subsp. pepo TaxID=3664 RepID=UPI000C9D9E48|nr:uncharacterized protein LOC111788778 isoform X3 [Cucurbita pepo subsp. pepo]
MKQLESDPLDFESDPLDFESDPLDFEYDPLVYKTAFESNGLCTEEEHCFEALILCSIITPRQRLAECDCNRPSSPLTDQASPLL